MTSIAPTHPNLVYARIDDRALTLDLYLPTTGPKPCPLILWIHGGAWRVGDKSWCDELLPLVEAGWALASVDYRLSQEAIFPAQIRDVKAAARWLRLHAAEYGLDPERFAAGGSSAGGHLAAMLGVSFYVKRWDLGGEYSECAPAEVSSAVQAVVDWFGPSDFNHMNDEPGDQDHLAPDSPESQLIGGAVPDHPDRVAAASPIRYVYPGFPPFLILHGDQDHLVLPNQSSLLHQALQKWWVPAELGWIGQAGHGFDGERYQQALEKSRTFLTRELVEKPLPKKLLLRLHERHLPSAHPVCRALAEPLRRLRPGARLLESETRQRPQPRALAGSAPDGLQLRSGGGRRPHPRSCRRAALFRGRLGACSRLDQRPRGPLQGLWEIRLLVCDPIHPGRGENRHPQYRGGEPGDAEDGGEHRVSEGVRGGLRGRTSSTPLLLLDCAPIRFLVDNTPCADPGEGGPEPAELWVGA